MKNSNTNPDNNPNQTPDSRARQAKSPDAKTTAAGYQKLPHKYRPKAGCDQRDQAHATGDVADKAASGGCCGSSHKIAFWFDGAARFLVGVSG